MKRVAMVLLWLGVLFTGVFLRFEHLATRPFHADEATGARITRLSADLSFPLFAVHVPALELAKHLGFAAPYGLVLAFVLAWVILWWTKPGAQRMEPVKH